MWPFKKKKKEPVIVENAKFQCGDFVSFLLRGDYSYGTVMSVKEEADGTILYDIQVGAQCPWIARDIPETVVKPHKIRY